MKLFVTGRHLVVSATTRQTLTRKLRRLERLMQAHAISAQCILARERGAYVCELTSHPRGVRRAPAPETDRRGEPPPQDRSLTWATAFPSARCSGRGARPAAWISI